MKALKTGLISLALLSGAATAYAQAGEETRLRPQWEKLDANRDGKVTIAELPPMMAGAMGRSDIDGNGEISLAEYVRFDHDPAGASRLPLSDNVRLIADLPYAATTDWRQTLDVYLPKTPTVTGPLPVIAYVHGGGWTTGSKDMARSQMMRLVQTGRYAAVSINYRLAWQSQWPAQIHDVKAAIRWIRGNAAQYGFDPKRICASGSSAGGHLVGVLGTTGGVAATEGTLGAHRKESSRVRCVVDMMGPADLAALGSAGGAALPSPIELMLGGKVADKADAARSASPLTFIDRSAPPFLLIHGSEDPVVPHAESVKMEAALRAAGVPVLFQTIDGGGHGDFGAAQAPVAERTRLFFEQQFYDPKIVVPTDMLKR